MTMTSQDPSRERRRRGCHLTGEAETAYESLRLTPGVDTSGRTLVWFAGRLFLAHERATRGDAD